MGGQWVLYRPGDDTVFVFFDFSSSLNLSFLLGDHKPCTMKTLRGNFIVFFITVGLSTNSAWVLLLA